MTTQKKFEEIKVNSAWKNESNYKLHPHLSLPFLTKENDHTSATFRMPIMFEKTFIKLVAAWRNKSCVFNSTVLHDAATHVANDTGPTAAALMKTRFFTHSAPQ